MILGRTPKTKHQTLSSKRIPFIDTYIYVICIIRLTLCCLELDNQINYFCASVLQKKKINVYFQCISTQSHSIVINFIFILYHNYSFKQLFFFCSLRSTIVCCILIRITTIFTKKKHKGKKKNPFGTENKGKAINKPNLATRPKKSIVFCFKTEKNTHAKTLFQICLCIMRKRKEKQKLKSIY